MSRTLFETCIQDVRYGLRALIRTPGFTGAALLTLTLAIGANTAIFTVVNAVLLEPLPYPEPHRLVSFVRQTTSGIGEALDGRRYLFYRQHLRSAEGLAAYAGLGSMNLVDGGAAEFVSVTGVSREYFDVFGVRPMLGSAFADAHDTSGGPDAVILSHGLWQRFFGSNPDVIGRTVSLGDRPVAVIGVVPASFAPMFPADLFLPLRPGLTGRGGGFNYTVAGRLRAGVSKEQASAEAASLWQAYREAHPGSLMNNERAPAFLGLQETRALPVRSALLMMLAAVGVLLLIACANTANLLLARAAARTREMTVRAALGAGRARIVRQLLTESLVLAGIGAALGVVVAYWMVPALLAFTPPAYKVTDHVRIDGTVLAVMTAIALATGLLFGLAPAASVSRTNLVEAFKEDSGRAAGSRHAGWLRRTLAVVEIALCMLLLIGAGLLVRTFMNLRAVDPGFDPRGILTARMSLQGERYSTPEAVNRLYDEGMRRLGSIPGVRAVAAVSGLPMERALNLNVDVLDGPQEERVENALTDWRYATAGYFEAMRIAVVEGRGFTEADAAGAPPVAVVSEAFARRFFRGTSAIGRRVRIYDADGSLEIVGVARDLKEGGLKAAPRPVMYVPVAQTHAAAIRTTHGYFQVSWIVRADRIAAGLLREIEQEIRAVDPRQPIAAFRTMDDVKSRAMVVERFQMLLLGGFGLMGLLLACAGVYGVIAYSVGQRTREFGIRTALGATRARIICPVLGQGAALAIAGILTGALAARPATRLLRNFVWGVSTLDVATFLVVATVLFVVACAASFVPAWRAVTIDPVTALRE